MNILKYWLLFYRRLLHGTAALFNYGVANLDNVKELRQYKKRGMLLSYLEAQQLQDLALCTRGLPGEMAEVGVYRGASAKLMLSEAGGRSLYLYDTFEGLPEPEDIDKVPGMGSFTKGLFACPVGDVLNYINAPVYIRKGVFPETFDKDKNIRFSFVHLDADLYSSNKAALETFYPRMVSGGIILIHDYKTCPGVFTAVHEYIPKPPTLVIPLSGNQAMIVKR